MLHPFRAEGADPIDEVRLPNDSQIVERENASIREAIVRPQLDLGRDPADGPCRGYAEHASHALDRRVTRENQVGPPTSGGVLHPPDLPTSHQGSSRIDSIVDQSAHSSSSSVSGMRLYPSTISRSIRSRSRSATRRSIASTITAARLARPDATSPSMAATRSSDMRTVIIFDIQEVLHYAGASASAFSSRRSSLISSRSFAAYSKRSSSAATYISSSSVTTSFSSSSRLMPETSCLPRRRRPGTVGDSSASSSAMSETPFWIDAGVIPCSSL